MSRFPKSTTQIWCMSDGKAYIVYFTPNASETGSPGSVRYLFDMMNKLVSSHLYSLCSLLTHLAFVNRRHHTGIVGMDFASMVTQKDLTSKTQASLLQAIQSTAYLPSAPEGKLHNLFGYQ